MKLKRIIRSVLVSGSIMIQLILASILPCDALAAQKNREFDETVQTLQVLYQSEQFVKLEQELNVLMASDDRFVSGKPKTAAAYWFFRLQMHAPGVAPNELQRINRWKQQIPTSRYTQFAESRYWYSMAWNNRGGGYGNTVSAESWNAFNEKMRRAESMLLDPSNPLKGTTLWYSLLLATSQDSNDVVSKPDQVFEEAIKKWPRYYDFYETRLTRLVPNWGGSWPQVKQFIDQWSRRQSQSEGDSMFARLFITLQYTGFPVSETKSNWPRLKKSFSELIQRYPDPKFKNIFASYACRAQDAKQFTMTMQSIRPEEIDGSVWLSDASYQRCYSFK